MDYETLLILAAFLALGLLTLALMEWRERKRKKDNPQADRMIRVPVDEQCCGRHLVCEHESLLTSKPEIVYYDDEELDAFAGRDSLAYTPDEEEQWRDVLYTLQPSDLLGWGQSIKHRGLVMPASIQAEFLQLATEHRSGKQ